MSEDLARGADPQSAGSAPTLGRESRNSSPAGIPAAVEKPIQPVQVKQEPVADEDSSSRPAPPHAAAQGVDNQHTGDVGQTSAESKNKCEKCEKGFPSLTLLRYHYCSHFR